MATRLNNGQKVAASFDVKDKKGKVITTLPAGATLTFTSSNEQVAQFAQDSADSFVGEVTTLHDEIGAATITGTITYADGASISAVLEVEVINSAPDTAEFTVGEPIEE